MMLHVRKMCDLFSGLSLPALANTLGDIVNSKREKGLETLLCRWVTLEEDPEVAAIEELIILEEISAQLDAEAIIDKLQSLSTEKSDDEDERSSSDRFSTMDKAVMLKNIKIAAELIHA